MTNSHRSRNYWPAPTLELVRAERASRHLREYIRQGWAVVEPGVDYTHGWHIDAIAEHLEAVTAGAIRNLIINIPPRCTKSLTVGVFWPTWTWIDHPEKQWLTSSYAEVLAVRDAVKSRRLIQSPWYQRRWGDRYRLAGDQNQKSRYENDHNGHRIATGVGGSSTGEGGDIIVADDALKAQDRYSDPVREAANVWWDETMSTRGNNPRTVARVIIMQRLHDDDLTGHVLEKVKAGGEHYEHLCLPMEYEPRIYVSAIGWQDPRQDEGALLWPERFGRDEVDGLKTTLGEEGAAGQLQQRPAPAGGAILKRAWWDGKNRFNAGDLGCYRRNIGRWLSFDTAFKDQEANDYTAWGLWEMTPEYGLQLRQVHQEKLEFPQLASTIEAEGRRWNHDGKLLGIIIEDKGSGTSAIQTLRQTAPPELASLLVAFPPAASKVARARQASVWCERGMIELPHPGDAASWLYDFEETLFKFPAVTHDDVVDQMTQAIIYLEHYLAQGWQAKQ